MSEERQRVLRMLKAGRITVEEAEALLEALGEHDERGEDTYREQVAGVPGGAGRPPGGPEPEAATPPGGPAPAGVRRESPAGDFARLIDDIVASVDVEGIVGTVRESLRRSQVDIGRIKGEVLRATERARDEGRRAAREYRRHGLGLSVARAIEGLWGLSDATGTWTHEQVLGEGRRLAIHNDWGDVKLSASDDRRLLVNATTRAWGADEAAAAGIRDQIRLETAEDGSRVILKVRPPQGEASRRYRVDFDIRVPAGIPVEVAQAKGDVECVELGAGLVVSVLSGDVSVEGVDGAVEVDAARGDVAVERAAGNVRVRGKHGDVALAAIGGGAEVSTLHGDVTASDVAGAVDLRTLRGDVSAAGVAGRVALSSKSGEVMLRRPTGPVTFTLQTASGDATAEVSRFVPGGASIVRTMSGDVSVRLGPQAHCRLRGRVTAGDLRIGLPLQELRQTRQSVEGVAGRDEASLEMSTVSGDLSVRPLNDGGNGGARV